MTPGRMHLLHGLSGSGKSTLVRELARDGRAVRFTLDEWMLRLHPDLPHDDEGYGPLAARAKDLVWTIAEQVLRAGTDVVLDWNAWSREHRLRAVERADTLGADVVLHVLEVSIDVASEQAQERTDRGTAHAHRITRAENEHLATLMEAPSTEEGLEVCFHPLGEQQCGRREPHAVDHEVAVAILVRNGQTFLAHRHPRREWYPDCWDLVGGHLEPGEEPLAALRRECREEIGIEVREARALELRSFDPSIRLHAYLVTAWDGEPVNLAEDEHDDLGWFGASDLPCLTLADPAVLPLLLDLLDDGRGGSGAVE